jgi:hypothetical protein
MPRFIAYQSFAAIIGSLIGITVGRSFKTKSQRKDALSIRFFSQCKKLARIRVAQKFLPK